MPLLLAPNLHSFTADGLSYWDTLIRVVLQTHHLTLKHVHIRYCSLAVKGITWILLSCPKLQTLSTREGKITNDEYSIEYPDPEYSDEYSPTEWHNIGIVLRKHGQTLQTLLLSPLNTCEIEETAPEVEEEPEVISPLGNLEPLNDFKHLIVPQFALLGQDYDSDEDYPHFEVPSLADFPPKSLESLAITHCSSDTYLLDKAIIEGHESQSFFR